MSDDIWKSIAATYAKERQCASFPAMLIDPLIMSQIRKLAPNSRVLDFGAGTGAISELFVRAGHSVVAIEPEQEMRVILEQRNFGREFAAFSDLAQIEPYVKFDYTLCINVLDHVNNPEIYLQKLRSISCGNLLLSVPHPLKDLGEWRKIMKDGRWEYIDFTITDYLSEGICYKNREDRDGNVVTSNVPSHHRTVSAYWNLLRSAGFQIEDVLEPAPSDDWILREPIMHSKCSRIPYFLVFIAH